MAALAALCLLLVFPLSSSQSTPQSEQEISTRQVTAAAPPPHPPLPPPRIRDVLGKEETNFHAKQTYAHTGKDNTKVGVFIAVSIGTLSLMAAMYCIYNRFYNKKRYLHTQLDNESDLNADPMDPPPVIFLASVGSGAADVRRDAYGSLSDTPSIISVPPSLSPPPSTMPFPPSFPSTRSLRTISAKDLEGSCV